MGEIFHQERPAHSLSFTGERWTSEVGGVIEVEHLHRYLIARDSCRGKDVVDVASGEGYGAALIAQVARMVIGVEVDPATVAHATVEYARPNLHYITGDARRIPLATASVDVVTSFETLEHLAEQDEFLAEIRRILRPGGALIMSTPDCDVYSPIGVAANPYHVRELSREEFTAILSRHFPYITMFAQRPLVGSAVVPRAENESLAATVTFERRDDQHLERSDGLPRPLYLIAYASDRRPIDSPAPSLYIHDRGVDGEVAMARADAYAAKQQLEAAQAAATAQLAGAHAIAEELRSNVERLAQERDSNAAALHRQRAAIRKFEFDIDQARREAATAHGDANTVRAQLFAFQGGTIWQATWPLRWALRASPPSLRRLGRRAGKLVWWSATLKLPGKLREFGRARAAVAGPQTSAAILLPTNPGTGKITFDPNAKTVLSNELERFAAMERAVLAPPNREFDPRCLDLHWVIPDFSAGGGGHMTIFRICNQLEARGHKITLWIRDAYLNRDPAAARETLHRHFQHLAAEIRFVDGPLADVTGDIIIATDAYTVPIVLSAGRFKRRFYFVQDFEPAFFASGTQFLLAESTYRAGLDCICAGLWLERLMSEKYGLWARKFWLAADMSVYRPVRRRRDPGAVPRIAFYARTFTERRAVELGLLAFEILAQRAVKFHVDFFGQEQDPCEAAPYFATNHGVCDSSKLAEIYAAADIGVVFSTTNYSLVSPEMMACRLPVLDLDIESTRTAYGEKAARLAAPDPAAIADAIEEMLADKAGCEAQADRALEWVSQFSWTASAGLVEAALIDRLTECSFQPATPAVATHANKVYLAAVVIPTYNGGELLKQVVARVRTQRLPGEVHFLCIDSSSDDGTNEFLRDAGVDLVTIPQAEFQHGRTRNRAVEMARAEFVAFLTQDALPLDDMWLYNLVCVLKAYPQAGGVFGRHVAYEDASEFVRRDIRRHFEKFDGLPVCIDPTDSWVREGLSNLPMKQLFHFYSDNNSCLRTAAWRSVAIPNLDYGEDQAFAYELLNHGYGKAYARNAVVYHSHNYAPDVADQRAYEEARFFNRQFGYRFPVSEIEIHLAVNGLNLEDAEWAKERRVPDDQLRARMVQNEARVRGWARAMRETRL